MKYVLLVIFSFLIILNESCTRLFLYSYGIRNPKIENEKSITKYLALNKLDTSNNFAFCDTAALNKFYGNNIGTPEIRFYDKSGFLMLYRNDKKCNAQNDSLIEFLSPENVVRIDSSENIFSYLNQVKTLSGNPVALDDFKNYDYYLIIYWAKWTGKVNSMKIPDWENNLAQKRNFKIKAIKLTTDYMNFWALDKNDMVKVYSPKVKTKDMKKERENKAL